MLKSEALLNLSAEIEKFPTDETELFKRAFGLVFGDYIQPSTSKENARIWAVRHARFLALCDHKGYTDAALMLGEGMAWLAPIVNYVDRTVRLVNGLGYPVDGDDHYSKAETIPFAILSSWLKARAKQLASSGC